MHFFGRFRRRGVNQTVLPWLSFRRAVCEVAIISCCNRHGNCKMWIIIDFVWGLIRGRTSATLQTGVAWKPMHSQFPLPGNPRCLWSRSLLRCPHGVGWPDLRRFKHEDSGVDCGEEMLTLLTTRCIVAFLWVASAFWPTYAFNPLSSEFP